MDPKQSKILILTVICVLIVAGAVYLFIANRSSAPIQVVIQTGTPTSTVPVDTYGMSQYIDQSYGFSFWYPSALGVTASTTNDSVGFPGGTAVETLQVGSMGGTSVIVVNSPGSTITDEPADHASPIAQTEYFYSSGQWMIAFPQGRDGQGSGATTTADISKTTMSGLIMLHSDKRFDTTIIPLGTTQFLVISDGGGSSFTPQLAQTVAQAGASVDSSAQATALQAEATAYAGANTK